VRIVRRNLLAPVEIAWGAPSGNTGVNAKRTRAASGKPSQGVSVLYWTAQGNDSLRPCFSYAVVLLASRNFPGALS
jgi:hypothetical protein